VHRDLKPENLLIDDDNNIKLCDFGWCVELEGSRSTVCGTYEYMAPELVNEDPYGQSIDVWSLGILLYELLHGYSPFRAKNTSNKFNDNEYIEIFRNIIKYDFQIEKELSFACSDLIKKLLAPDTKSRIKVRDIFYHPWVTSFEKEYKENKIKKMSEKFNNSHYNNDNSQTKTYLSTEETVKKSFIKSEIQLISDLKKKEEEIQNGSNKNLRAGYSNLNINNIENKEDDLLFDKVLTQVQDKNKTKKKKKNKKDNELQSRFNSELSIVVDNNNDLNTSNGYKYPFEKKFTDISIMNEIQDVENKLSTIENNNRIMIEANNKRKISNNNVKNDTSNSYSSKNLEYSNQKNQIQIFFLIKRCIIIMKIIIQMKANVIAPIQKNKKYSLNQEYGQPSKSSQGSAKIIMSQKSSTNRVSDITPILNEYTFNKKKPEKIRINFQAAVDILDQSNDNKNKLVKIIRKDSQQSPGILSFFSFLQCGNNNNNSNKY